MMRRPFLLSHAQRRQQRSPSLKCRSRRSMVMMMSMLWMFLTIIVLQGLVNSDAAAAAFHIESFSSSASSSAHLQQQHQSWLNPSLSPFRHHHLQRQSVVLQALSSSSSSSSSSDNENDLKTHRQWMESLRARQNQLSQQSQHIHDNWKSGRCDSQVAAVLGDWVRRLDVDYPLVACGSASEAIYVSHLETGHVVAESSSSSSTTSVNDDDRELPGQDHVYRLLFGEHDGGGTLAIAFYDNLIASAGRKGSVDLWRVHHHHPTTSSGSSSSSSSSSTTTTTSLIYQGRMVACQGVLVTSLQFHLVDHNNDGDAVAYLWIGTADGRVMAFDTTEQIKEDRLPLAVRRIPDMQFHFPDSVILSMAFTTELHMNDEGDNNAHDDDDDDDDDDSGSAGVGVITTSNGNIHLISLSPASANNNKHNNNNNLSTTQSPSQPSSWSFRLPLEVRTARIPKALATCACFVQHDTIRSCLDNGQPTQPQSSSFWSIAFGGSNGALYIQPLSMLANGRIDRLRPFDNNCTPMPLLPRHWGPTQCVATPMPGLLLSGGQDGSIRVWDVSCTNPPSSSPSTATTSMLPTTSTTSPSSSLPLPRPLLRRRFLYQFHGYKVWLKSLWCGNNMGVKSRYGSGSDGTSSSGSSISNPSPFLVSDGSDNTILLHKFNKPPPMNRKSNDINNNNNNNNE